MNIFLSTPISKFIDLETKLMRKEKKDILCLIFEKITSVLGNSIFFAAKEENWGGLEISDEACAVRDLIAMQNADLVIAILFSDVSEGVLIELGWASSMNKKIEIIAESNMKFSKLLNGISAIADFHINRINWNTSCKEVGYELENIISGIKHRQNNKQIINYFIDSWKKKKISETTILLSDDVTLFHPYFNNVISGKNNVINNLCTINLDSDSNVRMLSTHYIKNDVIAVKINESLDDGKLTSQNIILQFSVNNAKIRSIEFIDVDIFPKYSFYKNKENDIKQCIPVDIIVENDFELISMLIRCWSEKDRDMFIALFSRTAVIKNPIYSSELSPNEFFELMNAQIKVNTTIGEIKYIQSNETVNQKIYKVTVLETSKTGDEGLIAEMNLEIGITFLKIYYLKVLGYTENRRDLL